MPRSRLPWAVSAITFFLPVLALSAGGFDNAYRVAPISTDAPAVKFVGRFDRTDPAGPQFTWSGSQLIARFTGSSVSVRLSHQRVSSGNPIFYSYIVDGGKRGTFAAANATPQSFLLADRLGPGVHDVMLERETEGLHGISQFLGFDFGSGGALLSPYARTPRSMEIIGDSITTGFGNTGKPGCHYSSSSQSAFDAYGSVAARELGMDLTTIAYSGKGIHNNWNTVGNDPTNPTMFHDFLYTLTPSVYTPTQSDEGKSLYDFSGRAPDYVVINLGTNDFRNPHLTRAEFAQSYVMMLELVRSKYPSSEILAAVGSILEEPLLDTLRDAVHDAVASFSSSGDFATRYVEMTPQVDRWSGCDNHPDAAQDVDMAEMLVKAVRTQP